MKWFQTLRPAPFMALTMACFIVASYSLWFPWENIPEGDILRYNYPFLTSMRRHLIEQWIPLWFPEVMAGVPGLGEPNLNLFYPFFQLLHGFDANTVIKIHILFHAFVFMTGMWKWVSLISKDPFVVRMTTFLALLSVQAHDILQHGHIMIFAAVSFYPWLLYHLHKLVHENDTRNKLKRASWLVIIWFLLWVASHPQFVFILNEIAFLYFLTLQTPKFSLLSFKNICFYLICLLLGALAAAPQIWATLEILSVTARSPQQLSHSFLIEGSLHPANLLKWFSPILYGNPTTYWGQGEFWSGQLFQGLFLFIVFCLGFKKLALKFKIGIILILILALGHNGFLYLLHNTVVPGADLFRFPVRYLVAALPFLAYAIALGFRECMQHTLHKSLVFIAVLISSVPFCIEFFPELFTAHLPTHVAQRLLASDLDVLLTTFTILDILLIAFYCYKARTLAFVFSLVYLCTFHFTLPYGNKQPHVVHQNSMPPKRILLNDYSSVYNQALMTNVHDINGYHSTYPIAFRKFLDTQVPQQWAKHNRVQTTGMPVQAMQFFDIQNIYDKFSWNDLKLIKPVSYQEKPMGRYFLTTDFFFPRPSSSSIYSKEIVTHQQQLKNNYIKQYGEHPEKTIVDGKVTLMSYQQESLKLRVKTRQPAVLASSENTAPIWKVKVNGIEQEIVSWMGAFRAIFLPPGDHEVVFYIDRTPFYLSCIPTLVILFICLIFSLAIPARQQD